MIGCLAVRLVAFGRWPQLGFLYWRIVLFEPAVEDHQPCKQCEPSWMRRQQGKGHECCWQLSGSEQDTCDQKKSEKPHSGCSRLMQFMFTICSFWLVSYSTKTIIRLALSLSVKSLGRTPEAILDETSIRIKTINILFCSFYIFVNSIDSMNFWQDPCILRSTIAAMGLPCSGSTAASISPSFE